MNNVNCGLFVFNSKKSIPVLLFLLELLSCFIYQPPAKAQTALPPNLFADTLHAPFYHGVASGDPLSDRVILWTRITPPGAQPPLLEVVWQIAADSLFSNLVNSGVVTTSANQDWTVKVDATGLQPATTYYYRFFPPFGNTSATGRTKTAPQGNVNRLRFGVGSCSSIYSGYFNAYRRLSERTNLDAFIHLGDYIYDAVDENEQVRIPEPYPQIPYNLQSWRSRHTYYLLDPDLRAARAAMPWVVIWDNHDVHPTDTDDSEGARQAFWEYLPIRQPDTLNNSLIYRSLQFGNLVQVLMLDVLLHRSESEIAPGVPSMLGNAQFNWLTTQLLANNTQWRILGSQKMVGTWSIEGLPDLGFGDGSVADLNAWDGFPDERARLLSFLQDNNISNNIFISGDAHISMCMDLPLLPNNPISYNPQTGEGAVAVELLPSSISRGNFDETGLSPFIINAITTAFQNLNPHEVYTELTRHGYGILDITPDSTVAQIWYSVISIPSDTEDLGITLVTYKDENHWHRTTTDTLSSIETAALPSNKVKLYPNPAHNTITLQPMNNSCFDSLVLIANFMGKTVLQLPVQQGNCLPLQIDIQHLPRGLYFVRWQNETLPFVKW